MRLALRGSTLYRSLFPTFDSDVGTGTLGCVCGWGV